MKLEIKDKKDNPLLHRKEIEAALTFEGATPSNDQVKKELAAQLKADEKLVVVKHIYNQFGTSMADVLAYLYENEEHLKTVEFLKKQETKPGEKKPEAPAEKPAEKKEEPKGE